MPSHSRVHVAGMTCILTFASLTSLAGSAFAQKPDPPHAQSHPVEAVDQEQFIAYWTLEAGWGSELQLRNNMAAADLTVTPALRSANGDEIALSPVTIRPQEIKIVDLESAALASAPQ